MTWRKGNRLQLVREQDASEAVASIYDDVRSTLGVPHVNVLYQVYAYYPKFLEMHWRAMKPVVSTAAFFELAERIRADGYTRMHNYFEIPDLGSLTANMHFSAGAQHELEETVDLFQYNDALLLLLVSAQLLAFDGPVGDSNASREPAEHPVFTNRPIFVEEETAPAPTRKVFDEFKRIFGTPLVNSDYRALARWPDFVQAYWEVLKPINASPLFQQSVYAVREDAWNLVRELPGPIELTSAQLADAGLEDEQIASLVRITQLFVEVLSALVLNIAVAKISLEGGNLHAKQQPPAQKQSSPTQAA